MKVLSLVIIFISLLRLSAEDLKIKERVEVQSIQYEFMNQMVGKWKVTYSQGSDKDKIYGTGMTDISFILGSRYLVIHNKTNVEGSGYESYSYLGWDKVNSEYFLFRFDNIVLTRVHLSGKYNEKTKTFTFEGSLLNEDKNKLKIEYQIERENKIVGSIYLDEGKGLEKTYSEILIKQE
jgi:hypothetical protein